VTELVRRKRRLVLETPYRIRGRAVIVHVEAAGLRIREKSCRVGTLEITWAQIEQPGCGDYGRRGPPTGQRTEDGKMKLHPRPMMVKRAEVELSQFLLQWAERHGLTGCEMVRALTEQIQMCLKYMLRAERHPERSKQESPRRPG